MSDASADHSPVERSATANRIVVLDLLQVPPMIREGISAALTATNWKVSFIGDISDKDVSDRHYSRTALLRATSSIRSPTTTGGNRAQTDPILLITDVEVDVFACLGAGYRGVVSWRESVDAVLASAESVRVGLVVLSQSFGRRLRPEVPSSASADMVIEQLSPRQREVLGLIGEGLTHQQAATAMGLAKSTVDTYVSRIQSRLGLQGLAELVRVASAAGATSDDRQLMDRVERNLKGL